VQVYITKHPISSLKKNIDVSGARLRSDFARREVKFEFCEALQE